MQANCRVVSQLAIGAGERKAGRIADDVVSAVLIDALCDPEPAGV